MQLADYLKWWMSSPMKLQDEELSKILNKAPRQWALRPRPGHGSQKHPVQAAKLIFLRLRFERPEATRIY